ncbi:TetR/AcrR family transcriptional regulator [Actinoplanes sp. NPDC051851]|uniref:TetR/AcrR family transcriptional regulator n=1 Tax=Actinoplanes sp. NPDC051851 TaxID=3154753 RepID=UPI0034224635
MSTPTPRGPRGPYRVGIRRREQILEAATEVFAKHGYAGGSLRRIAEEIGVTPAALVRHFGSKEALFAAVLERSDLRNAADRLTGVDGLAFLRTWGDVIEANTRNRGMVELLLTVAGEATDPDHPARPFMTRRYTTVVSVIARAVDQAIAAGEIAPMTPERVHAEARGFIALMDGLELQWLLDPSVDLPGVYRQLLDATIARWQQKP